MTRKQYKAELIETLAPQLKELNWFQVSELMDQLDALVAQYANI